MEVSRRDGSVPCRGCACTVALCSLLLAVLPHAADVWDACALRHAVAVALQGRTWRWSLCARA